MSDSTDSIRTLGMIDTESHAPRQPARGTEPRVAARAPAERDMIAAAAACELSLAELERAYLARVLARTGGNKKRAAEILGIDRRTIYRWLAQVPTPGAAEASERDR